MYEAESWKSAEETTIGKTKVTTGATAGPTAEASAGATAGETSEVTSGVTARAKQGAVTGVEAATAVERAMTECKVEGLARRRGTGTDESSPLVGWKK